MDDPVIQRVLRLGCFFAGPGMDLRVAHAASETLRWEIFRGHLLLGSQARASDCFDAWHVTDAAGAARISVRWQRARDEIHVTRQILAYAFEAYEASPGVIMSRPVEKWVSELVGTIGPEVIAGGEMPQALGRLVLRAVVGSSRLPITSLETPLVEFSLGRLAYLPDLAEHGEPFRDPLAFLTAALWPERPLAEQAMALETALRGAAETERLCDALAREARRAGRGPRWIARLLGQVFNGAALSPYTGFVDALVALVDALAAAPDFGPHRALDVQGFMLRQLCRHLTAFDLSLFHNLGANYPDALFLDALLHSFLKLAEQCPAELLGGTPSARRRRRALRQASLARQQYEGHRVPDMPTSTGESQRVLPAPLARVPEEQIAQPGTRLRRLFVDLSTAQLLGDWGQRALAAALDDLDDPAELTELGMALFLDRPLGAGKQPGEVDQTPLVSYEAFSAATARRRVIQLRYAGWIDEPRRDALAAAVKTLAVAGVSVADLRPSERPGVVSIGDARKAALDFVLLRTTRSSLAALLAHADFPRDRVSAEALGALAAEGHVLVVQHVPPEGPHAPVLRFYRDAQPIFELPL